MAGLVAGSVVFAVGATIGVLVASYVLWVRHERDRYDLFWEEDDWYE